MRIFTLVVAGLLIAALLTVSCASTTNVSTILGDPQKYAGQQVTVKGTVADTVWVGQLSKGAYELDDGTGTIWVVTSQPPPQMGATVTSQGTVENAITLGDHVIGTHVSEQTRS